LLDLETKIATFYFYFEKVCDNSSNALVSFKSCLTNKLNSYLLTCICFFWDN